MSASSTLDPDGGPASGAAGPPGHDVGSLGPSDLSDTGSDTLGPTGYDRAILESDGDSVGTGVDPSPAEANDDDGGADIGFDRIVGPDEAGLGGGLDQAEEARYGVTDEDLDPVDEAGAPLDPDGGPRARRDRDGPPRARGDRDDAPRAEPGVDRPLDTIAGPEDVQPSIDGLDAADGDDEDDEDDEDSGAGDDRPADDVEGIGRRRGGAGGGARTPRA